MYTSSDRLIVTPLRGPKIVAILKAGFGPTVFPIYSGGAADGQPFGRTSMLHSFISAS